MKSHTLRKGFTLIELLVVIAIIAIMTGIIVTSLVSSKSKSRDAERVSDVNQIQLALEQFFDRCGQYPRPDSNGHLVTTTTCPGDSTISLGSYISVIPMDPSTKANYDYGVYNATTPTDYILHAHLENQNNAQANSFPEGSRFADISDNNWRGISSFNCYSGSNTEYCVSSK